MKIEREIELDEMISELSTEEGQELLNGYIEAKMTINGDIELEFLAGKAQSSETTRVIDLVSLYGESLDGWCAEDLIAYRMLERFRRIVGMIERRLSQEDSVNAIPFMGR